MFHADSVLDLLETNTIFLLALFVALAIITANETVRAAEVVILLQFCFGFLFTVSSTWGLRVRARLSLPSKYKQRVTFPLLGSTIRLCLACAICGYNIWFWFIGIDHLTKDPISDPNCAPVGFLFAPVNLLKSGIRIFFEFVATITFIAYGLATLSEVMLFLYNWVLYSMVAALIALLINLHRDVKILDSVVWRRAILGAVTMYSPLGLVGIPWMLMNGDSDTGLERPQLWFLIAALSVLGGYVIILLIEWAFKTAFKLIKSLFLVSLNGGKNLAKLWPSLILSSPRDREDIPDESINTETVAGGHLRDSHDTSASKGINLKSLSQGSERKLPEELENLTALPSSQSFAPEKQPKSQEFKTQRPSEAAEKRFDSSLRRLLKTLKGLWEDLGSFGRNDFSDNWKNSFHVSSVALNFICLVWSMLAVELIISWNNITGVYSIQSVGQLIPFIIGIVGFLSLVIDITTNWTEFWIFNVVMESLSNFRQNDRTGSETENPTIVIKPPPQQTTESVIEESNDNKVEDHVDSKTRLPFNDPAQDLQIHNHPKIVPVSGKKRVHPEHEEALRVESRNPTNPNSSPGLVELFWFIISEFDIMLSDTQLMKNEIAAGFSPLLSKSIGDQLIAILEKDASEPRESIKRTNARLAMSHFVEFKANQNSGAGTTTAESQRKARERFLEKLHHIDIDPLELALRWFREYRKAWWAYGKKKWKEREELRNGNGEMDISGESPQLVAVGIQYQQKQEQGQNRYNDNKKQTSTKRKNGKHRRRNRRESTQHTKDKSNFPVEIVCSDYSDVVELPDWWP